MKLRILTKLEIAVIGTVPFLALLYLYYVFALEVIPSLIAIFSGIATAIIFHLPKTSTRDFFTSRKLLPSWVKIAALTTLFWAIYLATLLYPPGWYLAISAITTVMTWVQVGFISTKMGKVLPGDEEDQSDFNLRIPVVSLYLVAFVLSMLALPEHPLFWKFAIASIVTGMIIAGLGLLPHDDKTLLRKYFSVLIIALMYLSFAILLLGSIATLKSEKATPSAILFSRLFLAPASASAMVAFIFYYIILLSAYPAWKRRSIYYFYFVRRLEQDTTPKTDQTS